MTHLGKPTSPPPPQTPPDPPPRAACLPWPRPRSAASRPPSSHEFEARRRCAPASRARSSGIVQHLGRQPKRLLDLGRIAQRRPAALGQGPVRLADDMALVPDLRALEEVRAEFQNLAL